MKYIGIMSGIVIALSSSCYAEPNATTGISIEPSSTPYVPPPPPIAVPSKNHNIPAPVSQEMHVYPIDGRTSYMPPVTSTLPPAAPAPALTKAGVTAEMMARVTTVVIADYAGERREYLANSPSPLGKGVQGCEYIFKVQQLIKGEPTESVNLGSICKDNIVDRDARFKKGRYLLLLQRNLAASTRVNDVAVKRNDDPLYDYSLIGPDFYIFLGEQ